MAAAAATDAAADAAAGAVAGAVAVGDRRERHVGAEDDDGEGDEGDDEAEEIVEDVLVDPNVQIVIVERNGGDVGRRGPRHGGGDEDGGADHLNGGRGED